MESLRRPSVLAALAAAILALSLVVLAARSGSGSGEDDGVADPGTEQGDADGAPQDAPDAGTTDGDGGTPQDGADDGDDAPQPDGGEGADDGAADGDGAEADDGGGDQDADAAGLGVPAAGDYAYASSGTWSLREGEQPEEHQLPAAATGTVQVDGDAWQVRLAAGEDYADRFGFALAADGGLDWSSWVLERQFRDRPRNETSYSCSGDAAYYRPDEQERVAGHQCESDAGITSDGQVEHLGTEDVTLGDGTVVTADRLLYAYTVTGAGAGFEVSGDGRLDLWLDPATGLRLREQRSISTTTTSAEGQESTYEEDVEFTLQSQQPS